MTQSEQRSNSETNTGGKSLAIMQPYFLPYIGYFQLLNAVDEFVVYDNIEYTKKGWINRNRILVEGKGTIITLPLKKDSDRLHIRERHLADSWPIDRTKLLNRITAAYRRAPHYPEVYPVLERILQYAEMNLFDFILHSLEQVSRFLGIRTPLIVSSTIPINHDLKAEQKVMAICRARTADTYVNPIGGINLYENEEFEANGIDLHFLKSHEVAYPQFTHDFVPNLSILDVMMFNPKDAISEYLANRYSLL